VVDQVPALLGQEHQLPGGVVADDEGPEPIPVFASQFAGQLGVQRIALGAAGFEDAAKIAQTTRVHRIEAQEGMFEEVVNQRTARFFQHHSDDSGRMLLAQAL
jgi:hypothetical protein